MPLPAASERAAADVERVLGDYDDALVEYIATGDRPPTIRSVLADLAPLIVVAVLAGMREVDPDVDDAAVQAAVASQVAQIERALRSSLDYARRQRRRAARTSARRERQESVAAFARRVGALAAFAALTAKMSGRSRRSELRVTARRVGVPLPRRTGAYARMVVRTETAIARNGRSAFVADRDGLVILVRDARRGPTDRACEEVNGRYATPLWIRRNPVEHPNCTRLGLPVPLPDGARVTLIE